MNATRYEPHSPSRRFEALDAPAGGEDEEKRKQRIDNRKAPKDARADGKSEADAAQRDRRRSRARIFFEGAHDAQERERVGRRKWAVLGVDEHVAVVERAGGEEDERDQAGERAADAAPQPPSDEQSENADGGADEPARWEQPERQNLGGERGEKIKSAAVHVEVDERQRPLVGEAG